MRCSFFKCISCYDVQQAFLDTIIIIIFNTLYTIPANESSCCGRRGNKSQDNAGTAGARGYHVCEAEDATFGEHEFFKNAPDAVVTDYRMIPGPTGYEFAKVLRQKGFHGPMFLLCTDPDGARINHPDIDQYFDGIFDKMKYMEIIAAIDAALLKE